MAITDRSRLCKLVRFPAVTVLTFRSIWVDVWSYWRLISYDPVTVVDLLYCKMYIRVCGSQSRVSERTSVTVWVSGSRRFDGSCSFHRDDQTQRSTVRVPNIFSSTVWNSLYVTSWQLESWCCSWIYGKICVPIPKRVVYCFCTVLIFRGRG